MNPVRITIDNRVRVDVTGLDDQVIAELKESFEHSNPEFHKRQAMGFSVWNTPPKIKTWRETVEPFPTDKTRNAIVLDFPRGGAVRVRDVLAKFGLDREYHDKRTTGVKLLAEVPDHLVTPWKHQERLVQAAIEQENCILKAPTGSGKTGVALAIAARLKLSTLVIVSTTALFKQWVDRATKELGIRKRDLGVIKAGKRVLGPLTIAMQRSLVVGGIDQDLARYFGVVICDEVQLFAAKTFVESVDPFLAKYRIGISADHRRKDKKEFLIHDLFGGVAAEVERRDLIASGVIVDTIVRVVPTDFAASWYGRPDDDETDDVSFAQMMGTDDRKSTFDPDAPPESGEQEKSMDWDRLLGAMAADLERQRLAVWCVRDGLRTDDQVIVMSHRRDHCRDLDQLFVRAGLTTGFLIGGADYQREFDETRKRFEKGELQVAVGTFQAIGYGIDLPKAAVVVCVTPIAANKQFFNQVRGRVCRSAKGKTESWMYYLLDLSVYGDKHLRNLVRWNGRVVVWESGKWVDAKEFLRARRIKAASNA